MAITRSPVALADRSSLVESSTATAHSGAVLSRFTAFRYTSGAGLPWPTSSVETVTSDSLVHCALAKTVSIRERRTSSPTQRPKLGDPVQRVRRLGYQRQLLRVPSGHHLHTTAVVCGGGMSTPRSALR